MSVFVAQPGHGAAWVTGASSGIGRALALELAAAGFAVFATARSADKLSELAAETNALKGHVIPMPGDVTDDDDMERTVAAIERQHGRLGLAIFSAGVYLPAHGEALAVADFRKSFDVNLAGVVNGLVPTIAMMKLAGRGQIVIISSVTGYGGLPTSAAYGATKAALINLAESLKFDLDKMGVRIQIVCPGFVDTPATERNAFPMPALMPVDKAAHRIVAGLKSSAFEIHFPKRFTVLLKLLRFMPYPAYFAAVNRATGWRNRPLNERSRMNDAADASSAE